MFDAICVETALLMVGNLAAVGHAGLQLGNISILGRGSLETTATNYLTLVGQMN
jgi:hypothetical protein